MMNYLTPLVIGDICLDSRLIRLNKKSLTLKRNAKEELLRVKKSRPILNHFFDMGVKEYTPRSRTEGVKAHSSLEKYIHMMSQIVYSCKLGNHV